MKKVVVVNAGPRMGWNTETLVSEAAKGAKVFSRDASEDTLKAWVESL